MYFIFYSIAFTILLLFFLNGKIDFNVYGLSNKDYAYQNTKELVNLSNKDFVIKPSPKDTNNDITVLGIVDTSFSTSGNNYWIATGNWSMKLKDNIPTFDLNMTWYNNKQSTIRTYHIFNYNSTNTLIGTLPNNLVFTNGTSSISLNNQVKSSVPISIQIQNNKLMTLYYNDIIFNRHFGNQPLHGIVISINNNKNNLSGGEPSVTDNNNNNNQNSYIQQQNNLLKNNIFPANNMSNSIDYNTYNQTKNTTTTTFNSIIIPQNAALIGNPSYLPSIIKINEGDKIIVINKDNNYHTVTSVDRESTNSLQLGRFFDSDIIYPQKMTTIDTSKLKPGEYPFECSVHPFMKGILVVR